MMPKSISISYIDVLTCLFTIFIVLFVLSEDKKETAKGNIIDPSQYLIEMTWADDSPNDIDLWLENPTGNIIFFRDRELGGMQLDTDNLGINTNAMDTNGNVVTSVTRREVASIRAPIAGIYTVNVMFFANRTGLPEKVKIHVMKLNPYLDVIDKVITVNISGEENTVVQFEIDKDGAFISKSESEQVSLFSRLKP